MNRITYKHTTNVLALFLILALSVLGSTAQEGIDDQVTRIANLLMCPVCQGQSVGESNSNLANDMRDIIRKQLEEGKSQEEILAYFVSSYGESILASPPPKGINWLLWLLPGAGIIVGGVVITLFLFRAQNEDNIEVEQDNATQVKVEDEYIKKIEEDLKKGDS